MSSDSVNASVGNESRWNPTMKVVVGVILFVLFALAMYTFRAVFVPLVVGAVLAYLLHPVARAVRRITRLPSGISAAIVYLVLLALLVPIGFAAVPPLLVQAAELADELVRSIAYLDSISSHTVTIMGLEIGVQDIVNEVTPALTSLARTIATESPRLLFDASKLILLGVFTIVISVYLTADARKFIDWFQGMAPPPYREDLERLLSEINQIWAAFFRGQLTLAVVVTLIVTALSAAIGLPQPFLMGILAGLMEFLTSVGHGIWFVTAVLVALVEGSTYLPISNFAFALVVAAVHTLYTQIDLNLLIPAIVGREVHLHPIVVIIGIIIGASIGGVLGILLAAPTIASLRILGRYIYAKLFDLDPFPMIGPPSMPREEREALAARLAAKPRMGRSRLGKMIMRVRDRR